MKQSTQFKAFEKFAKKLQNKICNALEELEDIISQSNLKISDHFQRVKKTKSYNAEYYEDKFNNEQIDANLNRVVKNMHISFIIRNNF